MFLVHKAQFSVFNYDEIPAGYYYHVMQNGSVMQRYWHQVKFKEVAARLGKQDKVLDLGCGPGSFLSILSKERPEIEAIGLDVASKQIDFAKQNIASQVKSNKISFQTLDLSAKGLPFEDNSFDAVTSIEVIEHIHPYFANRYLQEAMRVLKPSGKLIVTTPNYRSFWPLIEFVLEKLSPVKYHEQHISKFTPNSAVKFLETAGLEVKGISTIFISAPFLSFLPKFFVEFIRRFEERIFPRFGSLLILEANKIDWEKLTKDD